MNTDVLWQALNINELAERCCLASEVVVVVVFCGRIFVVGPMICSDVLICAIIL